MGALIGKDSLALPGRTVSRGLDRIRPGFMALYARKVNDWMKLEDISAEDWLVKVGGRNTIFVPMYGAPYVRDLDNQRRYGSLADLNNFHRLAFMQPALHSSSSIVCEPMEIPVPRRHLHIIHSALTYSDKPFMGIVTSKERAEDVMKMSGIVFGDDYVKDNTVVVSITNTGVDPIVVTPVTETPDSGVPGTDPSSFDDDTPGDTLPATPPSSVDPVSTTPSSTVTTAPSGGYDDDEDDDEDEDHDDDGEDHEDDDHEVEDD